MPYIDKVFRERLDQGAKPVNSGELNYVLTRMLLANATEEQMTSLCVAYLGDSPRYTVFNEVIGALMCCHHEFGRRHPEEITRTVPLLNTTRAIYALLDPYEDKKRAQNGDVQ